MARNVKFPLKMADGEEVRTLEEFKEHFDIESAVKYFSDGSLLVWLQSRYYDEEADKISKLSKDDAKNFYKELCMIFGIESEEEVDPELIAWRQERLNRLKKYTRDENILANVDKVAFNQEDLADLLDEGTDEIYLCANRFVIPLRMKNKVYIGVKDAIAVLGNNKPADFAKLGIKFKNVSFNNDSKKNSPAVATPNKIPDKNTSKPLENTAQVTMMIKSVERVDINAATAFVCTAKKFKSTIQLKAKGRTVDAKKIMMILPLELTNRNRITIVSKGSDAKEAVDTLKALIDSGFRYDGKPTIKIIVAEATTTIENKTGVHERPASVLVQLASKFESDIRIGAKGKVIDAKSILMIMSMGLVKGSELKIMAEGPDAQEAVKALKALVDSKFGED